MIDKNLHKLHSISLVNWHYFESQDFNIDGHNIYFRGANGVGKSTTLDAMQAILAGGDQRLIATNASSSLDGKGSARTLKSYALGETDSGAFTREISNTYLSMTFSRRDSKQFYSFGIYINARNGDKTLDIKHFIVPNHSLCAADFELDDEVLSWPMFSARLKSGYGSDIDITSMGKMEFRQKISALMSAPGASYMISGESMFQSIRSCLAFKKDTDIESLCRESILPTIEIGVNQIEETFKESLRFKGFIEECKKKVEKLSILQALFEKHDVALSKQAAYKWAQYESQVIHFDYSCDQKSTDLKKLVCDLEALNSEILGLDKDIESKKTKRDEALTAWKSSDISQSIERLEARVREINQNLLDCAKLTNITIKDLRELIVTNPPHALCNIFTSKLQPISSVIGLNTTELSLDSILNSEEKIESVCIALRALTSNSEVIHLAIKDCNVRERDITKELNELNSAVKSMQTGEASLSPATLSLIELLKQEGIYAKPVCELAEIVDPAWQDALEGYLSTNRETLILLDANEEPCQDSQSIEHAINLFRRKKREDKKLGAAKIANPSKLNMHERLSDITGFAASLVSSSNPVARKYLFNLLKNVKLVETDEELRSTKRGLSRDGTVAANGAITGVKTVRWHLFGAQARKDNVEQLSRKISVLEMQRVELEAENRSLNNFRSLIERSDNIILPNCYELKKRMPTVLPMQQEIAKFQQEINELKNSNEEVLLEKRYIDFDKELNESNANLSNSKVKVGQISTNIVITKNTIKNFEALLSEAVFKRNSIENKDEYEPELSSSILEKLQHKFGEDSYSKIATTSEEEGEKYGKFAEKVINNTREKFVEYRKDHTISGELKTDLSNRDIRDYCVEMYNKIVENEIVEYELTMNEKHQAMLKEFRQQVIGKLKESFQSVAITFFDLNQSLKNIEFNENSYRFKYTPVNDSLLRTVFDYTQELDQVEAESSDGLFAPDSEHKALQVIEDLIKDGRLETLSDYRNFFTYDLVTISRNTGNERSHSSLLKKASGGEKGTPLYVALAASLLTTYKIRIINGRAHGGAAIVMFDEAFSQMDGSNAQAALQFFSRLGLQVLLAAPPESEYTISSSNVRKFLLTKSNGTVEVEYEDLHSAAFDLLRTDDPSYNSEMVEQRANEIRAEREALNG